MSVGQHGGASLDRENLPRPTQLCGSARMVGIISSISPMIDGTQAPAYKDPLARSETRSYAPGTCLARAAGG